MGYLSRKPDTSNDPPKVEAENTKWVAERLSDLVDIKALLLWEKARRCARCNAPALLKYLEKGLCPDCRGVKIAPTVPVGSRFDVVPDYEGD